MSQSIITTNTYNNNSNSNVGSNSNTKTSISSSTGIDSPSMQDLMSLLQDQSKVISGLQRTIEGLNETIKSLNGKIESLRDAAVDKEVINVTNKVSPVSVIKEVFKNVDVDVDMINVNVTTSSNDHPKTVHENAQSPKCLGKTSHNLNGNEKAVGLTVHENVKPSNVKPSNVSGENASGENVKHKVKCKQLLL